MTTIYLYVVTEYGCNSTPSDLIVPSCTLFENYEYAYEYFLRVSPDLNDPYNKATKFRNDKFDPLSTEFNSNEILIENRVQISCFLGDENDQGSYAKRPSGVSISKCRIRK